MYLVQAFSTQNYILFKISAWGLFLKIVLKISQILASMFLENIFL